MVHEHVFLAQAYNIMHHQFQELAVFEPVATACALQFWKQICMSMHAETTSAKAMARPRPPEISKGKRLLWRPVARPSLLLVASCY